MALRGFGIKAIRLQGDKAIRNRPILSYTVILNLFQDLVEMQR